MSDTPLTDHAKWLSYKLGGGPDDWVVDVEFARDLERQLAEAKKELAEANAMLDWIEKESGGGPVTFYNWFPGGGQLEFPSGEEEGETLRYCLRKAMEQTNET